MFQKQYEDCQNKLKKISSQCGQISFCRLISSITAAVFLCLGCTQANPAYFVLSAAFALIFLLLVIHNHKLTKIQSYLTNYQTVVQDWQARLTDGWKQFSIHGTRYLHNDHPETADLDIFGQNSLYQYICTASTVLGQDRLACWLGQTDQTDIQAIKSRQQAVEELARKTDFTLHFEASARSLRDLPYDSSKKTLDSFFQSSEQKAGISLAGRTAVSFFPALTLACFIAFLAGIYKEASLSCFLICAALQLAAALLGHARNSRMLAPVYKMNQTAAPYRNLMEQLVQESFDSPYLIQLQQSLKNPSKGIDSIKAFKELESIADALVIRHNAFAFFILNSLFCYDFHCVHRYCRWKNTCHDMLHTWMETVGTIEALISLGVIRHTRQPHTLPQITDADRPELSAAGLQHPLLKDAVGNDFDLMHNTNIITGSNMSGKTTFMRSIGVNLILAYAGGFCTASKLCVSYMKICTSMRIEDNVNEGISTFYAELLRIKKIMETVNRQKPMLSLIDEIYKGTNAKDRIFAARITVQKISRPYAYTILTTHDFELCDLENESSMDAENYYFSEQYSQDKILFDYKIKQGRCTTANARELLRMAGILS